MSLEVFFVFMMKLAFVTGIFLMIGWLMRSFVRWWNDHGSKGM